MPVYNAERYLSQAIESILGQSFRDFELLILDDGSSDKSTEIARAAAKRDSRAIFVNGGHHGVVYWRNAGVDQARGEYLAMMDADDISLPDRLTRQVQFLDAHPGCYVLGTQALRIDPDSDPIDMWRVPLSHDEIDAIHMQSGASAIINPAVMMRTGAVRKAGGYRPGFDAAEDYDLLLRIGEIGQMRNLPDVLVKYRLHSKSLTLGRSEIQVAAARKALEEAWSRRKQSAAPPTPLLSPRATSEEALVWYWALSAFAARNFKTARKHAFRLLKSRPLELRRWILFSAACMGPVASFLRRVVPFRVGGYQAPPVTAF